MVYGAVRPAHLLMRDYPSLPAEVRQKFLQSNPSPLPPPLPPIFNILTPYIHCFPRPFCAQPGATLSSASGLSASGDYLFAVGQPPSGSGFSSLCVFTLQDSSVSPANATAAAIALYTGRCSARQSPTVDLASPCYQMHVNTHPPPYTQKRRLMLLHAARGYQAVQPAAEHQLRSH